jgi:hypothetical protein
MADWRCESIVQPGDIQCVHSRDHSGDHKATLSNAVVSWRKTWPLAAAPPPEPAPEPQPAQAEPLKQVTLCEDTGVLSLNIDGERGRGGWCYEHPMDDACLREYVPMAALRPSGEGQAEPEEEDPPYEKLAEGHTQLRYWLEAANERITTLEQALRATRETLIAFRSYYITRQPAGAEADRQRGSEGAPAEIPMTERASDKG